MFTSLKTFIPVYRVVSNMVKFNEFQGKAYETFKTSQKNIILEAPTGVGKTYFFLYLMQTEPAKIVYVSPLRALSQQVYQEISKKRSAILQIGDVYLDDAENIAEDVVLTTYEKMDSMIRHGYKWLDDIKLILLDEIHNMRDRNRAIPIELIAQWALEKGIRIVTASATLPSIDELKEWLDAEIVYYNKRPTPLYEFVMTGNTLYFVQNNEIQKTQFDGDIVDYFVKKEKVVMIFENTRKNAEALANYYNKKYPNKVMFFHGGLSAKERAQLLEDIKNNKYSIIVSTTALGQGVNLPFYAVIFNSLKLPVIENGLFKGWRDLDVMNYKQIAGRAGRPGFDKEGISIIKARDTNEAQYLINKYILGKFEDIPKSLPLSYFVLVKTSINVYIKKEELNKLLKLTYSLRFKELDDTLLKKMQRAGLIIIDENKGISSTSYGRAVSLTYITLDDAEYYHKYIDAYPRDDIHIVCGAPSVKQVSRGKDTTEMIQQWTLGKDEKEIVKDMEGFTIADFKKVKDTVAWQMYAWSRILDALGKKDEGRIALLKWLSIRAGVPIEALALIRLPGIGRKTAIKLLKLGIHNKTEICNNLNSLKQDLPKEVWRLEELCQKKK